MKKTILFLAIIILFACNHSSDKIQQLQNQVDSLQQKLNHSYKPGLGEFMSSIQVHHAKLWFAGQNKNWKLADFEVHEIMESLDDIKQYETERKESKMIPMLDPAIDSINKAISEKNTGSFNKAFINLTNTCNNCHRANNFEFNVVKIPESVPFLNQDFSAGKK
jgi:hypothetical protein